MSLSFLSLAYSSFKASIFIVPKTICCTFNIHYSLKPQDAVGVFMGLLYFYNLDIRR